MSIKIYKKRGPVNYKERRLLNQLEPALEKLAAENPAFAENFTSVENFEQLKALHSQYCIDDAVIIEETKTPDPTMAEKSNETTSTGDSSIKFQNPETPLEDPMNRANPIIRDHVLNDSFSSEAGKRPDIGGRPDLAEPSSYEEAFKLPDEDLDPKDLKDRQRAAAASNKAESGGDGGKSGPDKHSNSVNPAFDDMSQQRKNKQTKRFAKYIVEFFAMGMEMGYIWFVTKDISDLKIAEYELKDKIDPNHLELIMNLTEEQEVTIRQFFQMQCAQAQVNAKVSDDDKSELADALADVLMEKGFAPTPMQSLMMVMGQIVAAKAIPAFVQVQQNNSILNQLFTMRAEQKKEQGDVVRHAVKETSSRPAQREEEREESPEEPHAPDETSTELTVQETDENPLNHG